MFACCAGWLNGSSCLNELGIFLIPDSQDDFLKYREDMCDIGVRNTACVCVCVCEIELHKNLLVCMCVCLLLVLYFILQECLSLTVISKSEDMCYVLLLL